MVEMIWKLPYFYITHVSRSITGVASLQDILELDNPLTHPTLEISTNAVNEKSLDFILSAFFYHIFL